MTAVIDGVMVTGTVQEISQLIKMHNSKLAVSGTTTIIPFQTTGGVVVSSVPKPKFYTA